MLFFDKDMLQRMKRRFADSRWPDYHEPFLFQSPPATLQGGYDVLRWNGREFALAQPTDAKFASWIITENSVAWALGDDTQHRDCAAAWVHAALNTELWQPRFAGNADLFHGNLLYALAMYVDLVERDPRVIATLLERGATAFEWFSNKPPVEQRYTQNHFYIPFTGLLCAAIVLRDEHSTARHWLDVLRQYPPLIFEALGRDGWFFEGPDYFHYAFIWLVRLAEVCERHLGLRVSDRPCFAKLKHFLRWMYFPQGDSVFAIGDASAKEYNFSKWDEHESGQRLMSDNRLQNFAHLLYWIAARNNDGESRWLADQIRSRSSGFRWHEGFWCLAWECPPCEMAAEPSHLFDDHGIWCADATGYRGTLRVVAKCGPPMGRQVPDYAYDAGHCHPDAGAVLAAINDTPILLGPGYLGRKSGTYLNIVTFDGRGQGDDRLYHALNGPCVDYASLLRLSIQPEGDRHVRMDAAGGYPDEIGVNSLRRDVELVDGTSFVIRDEIELSVPRRPEARFRISDPPTSVGGDFVAWTVGQHRFQLRINASSDYEVFISIGEVITINDDGRSGPFEAGSINQRGYQILIRPRQKLTNWHARYEFALV